MTSSVNELASGQMVYIYFSDFFAVAPETLEAYGAFNVSLINDLPLFIDPFLLFDSEEARYQALHDEVIQYLKFLRDASADESIQAGLLDSWFRFPEVKQNWLGFSKTGNNGSGLGADFARSLQRNLHHILAISEVSPLPVAVIWKSCAYSAMALAATTSVISRLI